MTRVTADSNIYVSALIFGGKPLALLDLAQDGHIELAISDDILAETLRVVRDKFHRTPEELQADETLVCTVTTRVQPIERLDSVPSDPDDNRVLECAIAAGSEVIVSGDQDLLGLGSFRGMKIVRVSDFLDGFGEARPRDESQE